MKQLITKEQWDELSEHQVIDFVTGLSRSSVIEPPSIGQMIEFLGDDLISITFDIDDVNYNGKIWYVDIEKALQFDDKELADALFEAVKNKLK